MWWKLLQKRTRKLPTSLDSNVYYSHRLAYLDRPWLYLIPIPFVKNITFRADSRANIRGLPVKEEMGV